jgi:hypothetical protein
VPVTYAHLIGVVWLGDRDDRIAVVWLEHIAIRVLGAGVLVDDIGPGDDAAAAEGKGET